jgi:hypothetical protein
MKKILFGVVLILVAYAGFRWGPAVFPGIERALGIDPTAPAVPEAQATPELAERTLDLFERFRAGEAGDRLVLGGTELSAVVRYSLPGIVPRGITAPTIELDKGRVRLSARVAVEAFPDLPRLDQIIGLLPDTILIEIRGSLVPLDQRHMALLVDRLQAARIPIPTRLAAEVLKAFGRSRPASLPDDAVEVPLPDGLRSAFVQRDSLVLLADPLPATDDEREGTR